MPAKVGGKGRRNKQEVTGRINWNQATRDAINHIQPLVSKIVATLAVAQLFAFCFGTTGTPLRLIFMSLSMVACYYARDKENWNDEKKRFYLTCAAVVTFGCGFSSGLVTPLLGGLLAYAVDDTYAYPIAFVVGLIISFVGFAMRFRNSVKFDVPTNRGQ